MVNGTNKHTEVIEECIHSDILVVCHNQCCSGTREMVKQLRNTVEVFEAELWCLRAGYCLW